VDTKGAHQPKGALNVVSLTKEKRRGHRGGHQRCSTFRRPTGALNVVPLKKDKGGVIGVSAYGAPPMDTKGVPPP
jgi:hypothetical protein